MTMKNITRKLSVVLLFVASACQLDNDTLNPNTLTPGSADPDLLMSSIQLDFASFFSSASGNTDQLVRVQAMTGGYRYPTAINSSSANGVWGWGYQAVLINTKTLIPIAQAKKLTTHVAMAKIFEAYVYLTLVDMFNDVPQSDALGANQFPKTDNSSDVYTYAIGLLGEARAELAKTGTDAGTNIAAGLDLYYGGDRAKWTALVNSLEIKAWMNIRTLPTRAAEADIKINALLFPTLVVPTSFIDTEAENFTFKYGIATVPLSRHPLYEQYYGNTAGTAGGYFANYFLNEMYNGRGVQDPRWRYYFYRQVGSIVPLTAGFDVKALGCAPGTPPSHYQAVGAVFCVFEPGFYGRDHGDASGTPPDGGVITAAGVYPAGGRPDNNSVVNTSYNKPTKRGDGANGAGIQAIYMSFFTDFVKAEILARRGDAVNAKIAMTTGINNSIAQVKSFAVGKGQAVTPASLEPSTTAYQAAVSTAYDAAANKLDVIGREFYIAAFGNGIEAYNSYRRTSAPRNLQPTLQVGAGPWTRAFPYPATYSTLAGGPVKDNEIVNKVFWDGNTETLN
jgi:hypothetical protein